MEPLQAKGYLRLSTYKEESTSPPRQLAAIKAVIRLKSELAVIAGKAPYKFDDGGWTPEHGAGVFGDLYVDLDRSAYSKNVRREAHQALLENPDVDLIAVWEASRWDRRMLRFVSSLAELQAKGIGFVSAAQQDLDTTGVMGQLILILHAAFAQIESETLGRRVRETRSGLLEDGYYPGGTVPVGYRRCTEEERKDAGELHYWLVQDEKLAPVLQRAAELVVNGNSWTAAAARLNEEGLLTRTGTRWRGSNLAKILTGPSTAGYLAAGDDYVRNADGDRVRFTDDPVLHEPTWQAIRAQRRARPGGARRATLLHGIARCASCGGPMRGSGSNNPTYACPRGADGTGACAAAASVSRKKLDEFVVTYALARLDSVALGAADDGSVDEHQRQELQRKLAKVEAQVTRLEEDRAAGAYDHAPERWRDQQRAATARLQEFRRAIEDLEVTVAQRSVEPLARSEWEALSLDEQRQVLGLLIEAVRVEKPGQGRRFSAERIEVVPRT